MQAKLQERIEAALPGLHQGDQPGLVIGVAWGGRTIYRRGFGLASIELGVANRPQTRFRIGSTSKHFACLAVMLLAEEGKLDIDANVRKIIPELPAECGEPTLRQLMTHTSGLRDFLDVSFMAEGLSVKPRDYAPDAQLRLRGSNFAPGQMAMYNNGGYQLISLAIDRVAGEPMEEFVARRILSPVGMNDTSWAPSDLDVVPGMATLYMPAAAGSWRKGLFPYENMRGEGGMVSTVDDMLRWLAHMRADVKVVGSAETWRAMTTPAELASGARVPYAFGLMPQAYRGFDVIHHGGGVLGGACQMITMPSRELDVVILTNGALVNHLDLAETVMDCVLDEESPAGLEPRVANAAADAFRGLVGTTYRSATSDLVVRFDELGGCIYARICNTLVPLTDASGDLAVPFDKVVTGPIVFHTARLEGLRKSAPNKIAVSEGCVTDNLSRVGESPAAMAEELVGQYSIPEFGAHAEVRIDDGRLKLIVQGFHGQGAYFLQAIDRDAYSCEYAGALPMGASLTVMRDGDQLTGFSWSSLRTRAVMFVPRGAAR